MLIILSLAIAVTSEACFFFCGRVSLILIRQRRAHVGAEGSPRDGAKGFCGFARSFVNADLAARLLSDSTPIRACAEQAGGVGRTARGSAREPRSQGQEARRGAQRYPGNSKGRSLIIYLLSTTLSSEW